MYSRARTEAPAKLNLHLEVGPVRADGYHELRSIFQAISLADVVEAERVPGTGVEIEGNFGFPASQNIIDRACRLFFERSGLRFGLRFRVDKRIPMGSGMGGGSSDAAACLACLNALSGGILDGPTMDSLAAQLGSDVPFFLHGPLAWVEGRGERVSREDARQDLTLVIVDAGIPLGTDEAYRELDCLREGKARQGEFRGPEREEAMMAYRGRPREWPFFNSFQEGAFKAHPELEEIRSALMRAGADFALMSGSGSAVYGVFEEERRARDAADSLAAGGARAQAAFLLARGQKVIVE